nr:MAG TPA: hypothetical protein [Caudoviricetes sp.]
MHLCECLPHRQLRKTLGVIASYFTYFSFMPINY